MENLLSHTGIFFTMAAVLTFEAILLRLASEPEGGREVKARKGESHLGAFIRENWYWLLLLFCALGALCCAILRSCMIWINRIPSLLFGGWLCAYGLLRFLANSIWIRGFYKGVSNVHCLSLLSFPWVWKCHPQWTAADTLPTERLRIAWNGCTPHSEKINKWKDLSLLKRKASPKGYRVSLDTSPDLSLKEEFRPPYTKRNCPMWKVPVRIPEVSGKNRWSEKRSGTA